MCMSTARISTAVAAGRTSVGERKSDRAKSLVSLQGGNKVAEHTPYTIDAALLNLHVPKWL